MERDKYKTLERENQTAVQNGVMDEFYHLLSFGKAVLRLLKELDCFVLH